MTQVRIATFNVENLDEVNAGDRPTREERIDLMKPQIIRLRADIVCFQEVHGQERDGQPRALIALQQLLAGTNLKPADIRSTEPQRDAVYDERNLVVASLLPVQNHRQVMNDLDERRHYALRPSRDGKPWTEQKMISRACECYEKWADQQRNRTEHWNKLGWSGLDRAA